jgi:NadR type nicotinamide-nucleotide adenylyltransferase
MRTVVVTGPESTGKTTLVASLAQAYDTACSPEFARRYAETHPSLGADDVEPIARGEIIVEDLAQAEAGARGRPIVIHDVDLVSTVVYARHYYGACPPWIVDEARGRRADLYLLCAPDVPWIPDGIRDLPMAREQLFTEFRATLAALGCTVVELRGSWAEREAMARAAVDTMTRPPLG